MYYNVHIFTLTCYDYRYIYLMSSLLDSLLQLLMIVNISLFLYCTFWLLVFVTHSNTCDLSEFNVTLSPCNKEQLQVRAVLGQQRGNSLHFQGSGILSVPSFCILLLFFEKKLTACSYMLNNYIVYQVSVTNECYMFIDYSFFLQYILLDI